MEAASSSRCNRIMMEGVGARVIRGPDWKWGKQVCICFFFSMTSILSNVSRTHYDGIVFRMVVTVTWGR